MVDPVNESLPELIARRQRDLGAAKVAELYRRLPDGEDRITYETVRKLANGEQRSAREPRVFRDLALILSVDESVVRLAMGVEPSYGEFEMPPRAQGLDHHERDVVLGVMDALLRAKRQGGQHEARHAEAEKTPQADLTADDYTLAAREHGTGYSARKKREQQEWDDITGPQ